MLGWNREKMFANSKNLVGVPKVGAIWLFGSGTANSVYRFIRFQQNRKPTSSAVPDKSLLLPLSESSITQTDRSALSYLRTLSYLRKQVSSSVPGDWIPAPDKPASAFLIPPLSVPTQPISK